MTQPTNPLINTLKARMPGETFRLPSQAYFYDDTIIDPDVKNGEVHVYPLTAVDEIILGTPDKLLNGTAVNEVFRRCVPQIRNPMRLLHKDVDFLLACLRYVSYGGDTEVTNTHDCKGALKHTYTVNLQKMISQATPIDLTSVSDTFSLVLENGQEIEFHPPIFEDVIDLYQNIVLKKQDDMDSIEIHKCMIRSYANLIKQVSGISDHTMIYDWLLALSGKMLAKITDKISDLGKWGLDSKVAMVCKDCNQPMTLEINANPISFFI